MSLLLVTVTCHCQPEYVYKSRQVAVNTISSVSVLEQYTSSYNMKFSTKFLSRQGRRVHPENVTSLSENSNKLRDVLHHLQVALQHIIHIDALLDQQRALKKKANGSGFTVDLSVLENQRNEYVTYVRQQSSTLRHLESSIRHQEMTAKPQQAPDIFVQGTG